MRLRSLGGILIEREGHPSQMFSAGSEFECDDEQAAAFIESKLAERIGDDEPRSLGEEIAAAAAVPAEPTADGREG